MSGDFKEFAELVAAECEQEIEYDGQTLIYCFYCGAWLDEHSHHDDCKHMKAKKLLSALPSPPEAIKEQI